MAHDETNEQATVGQARRRQLIDSGDLPSNFWPIDEDVLDEWCRMMVRISPVSKLADWQARALLGVTRTTPPEGQEG